MPQGAARSVDQVVRDRLQSEWRELRRRGAPAAQLHWLQQWGHVLFGARRKRELIQEMERVRVEIRRRVCSTAWFVLCWEHGHVYAPDRPCRCEACRVLRGETIAQRLWPGIYVGSGGYSYECMLQELGPEAWSHLPSSPTGIAFQRMRAYGTRITKRVGDAGRAWSNQKQRRAEKRAQQDANAEM